MMYLLLKRILDLIIAVVTLFIFSPLLIPIMVLLRFTGEGEVFYLQERIGQNNKPFNIWKFATMLKNSPNMGTGDVTLKNDSRVLPFGNWLRKTKINELPQIFNVLNGTMSIVGARPLVDVSFNMYPPKVKELIYNSPPGITGIGSLIFRDEESIIDTSDMNPREFYKQNILPYKGTVEVWYQQQQSIIVDIKIIILTAWAIIFSKSELTYRIFPDLPPKPDILSIN